MHQCNQRQERSDGDRPHGVLGARSWRCWSEVGGSARHDPPRASRQTNDDMISATRSSQRNEGEGLTDEGMSGINNGDLLCSLIQQ